MTKARTIADLGTGFENITDTGTEGTKVATGTTAQRGSTAGQLRFNSDLGLAEYYDGTSFKAIDSPPSITSVTPTNVESSTLPANLTITGTSFSTGANVSFTGNTGTIYNASSVTRNSSTELVAVVPTSVTGTDEPYIVTVTNSSGLTASLDSAFNIDQAPEFSVASGSLGSIDHRVASDGGILTDIPATDDEGDSVTVSTSSTLPTGLSLSTGGVWSGTITQVPSSDTTYNITASATDGTNTSNRNYSFTNKAPSSNKIVVFGNTAGNEYIEHTSTGTFGNDLTICAWVKTLRDNPAGVIVQQGAEFYGNEYGWEWGLGTYTYSSFVTSYNNRPVFMSDNNSGNHNAVTLNVSSASISNNTWTWLAVTKSGSTITHYINGSTNGSGGIRTSSIAYGGGSALTISGKQPNTTLNNGQHNGIGGGYGNGGTFQGYIDEVGIWNTALSSSAISDLYNNMNNGYVNFNSNQGSNYTQTSNLQRWCAMGEFTNSSTEIRDEQSGGWTMNNITSSNLVSR